MLFSDNCADDHTRELSFRHLQLHPAHIRELADKGIHRIADIGSTVGKAGHLPPNALRRIELVRAHVSETGIDWTGFWNEPEVQIHWLAMTFPDDLIDETILDRPLSSLQREFGALLNIPRAVGFKTLRDLVSAFHEGVPTWPGFGPKKVFALGERLQKLALGQLRLSTTHLTDVAPAKISLPPDVLEWDMGALGLGKRGLNLRERGFGSLASLLVDESVLLRLPNVGRRTISLAKERLHTLSRSIDGDQVNLDKLGELQEVPVIPNANHADETSLRSSISTVIRSLAAQDGSEAAMPIFEHRICTGGSDLWSLEQIADTLPNKLTRERVRQIEKRILGCAAEIFLSPFPIMGKVVVRPSLRSKFRNLALAMREKDQINPEELALLMSSEWGCTLAEAVEVLPMVMAVIEGTARTFHELRRLVDTPHHLFTPLEGIARNWPAQNIGAERTLSVKLEASSIDDLEDLRLAWIRGSNFGRHEEYVQSVLAATADRNLDNEDFTTRLGALTARAIVPEKTQSWKEFVASLPSEIRKIIRAGTFWTDAELIFDMRTNSLPNERITLDALGQRIGRLGITVKQTESETLQRLGSSILQGRGGYSQCILPPDWLKKWRTLKSIYDRFPNDQRTFRRSIEEMYEVSETDLTMAMPTMWAILTGLPSRQSFGRVKVEKDFAPALAPIKLSGFRTLH